MIAIDYRSGIPIYLQIADAYEKLISLGVLKNDSPMPSVRQLAMELSINPNTIQKAYRELEKRGLLYSVSGKGSFVAVASDCLQEKKTEEFRNDLHKLIQEGLANGVPFEKLRSILLQAAEKPMKEGN